MKWVYAYLITFGMFVVAITLATLTPETVKAVIGAILFLTVVPYVIKKILDDEFNGK